MLDAGGPHDRGRVMFDSRRMVLVEQYEVAVAHATHAGEPLPDRVAIQVRGRINRPPDDQSAASAPAEPVEHLHMTSWELAAALVAELHALAGRDGTAVTFNLLVKDTYAKLVRNGLTASPADRGER